jgi:PKD repeat protein/pimeloyl-ACP methyl ester carboxylesterase
MQLHSPFIGRLLVLCHAAGGLVLAQTPPLQTTGIEVDSSNERTALVRTTGKLASTVDVTVKNTGDRPLLPPFHAVITFTPIGGGDLTTLTMPGALGGLGKDPYQTFYRDLTAVIGEGLAPGAGTTFNFTFERPQTLSVSYTVAIHCNRNRDPVAVIGGPYSGQQGVALPFDASASSDPDGDALTFRWDFGDGNTATGPTPEHTYAENGLFTVFLTVTDARGAAAVRETQVPVVPPGVFALARTRTLDGNGHPLGEVTVSQTGPDGPRAFRSDAVSGFTSLGGAPGGHIWGFARAGYLTAYRKATLDQGQVKVVAFPWLTALNAQRTPLSLLNPTVVQSADERVSLTFPPEAFEQVESVAITGLGGQTLPLPLPVGWSPLAAFHVALPGEAAADVAASLKLLQNLANGQALAMVRLDEEALVWKTEALLSGSGGDGVAAVLRKPGSYAVVLADTLPAGNPAVAVVGEPLPAGTAPVIAAEVTAVGLVNPGARVASLDPERVTAEATVDFTNGSQPLASGAWFRAEVEETYDLSDGRALKTPDYDATFYAYQNPGDASPLTATAKFPLRPRVLFGPEELGEARIKVDVLALSEFSGGILAPDGGSLALGGVRISVPAGAVAGPAAAEIRLLPTANLGRFLGGFEALLAFELNLPALADGSVLTTEFTEKLAPNRHFILARCVVSGSQSGLQPVLRLRSDAQGVVSSNEPASGPRLPGISGSGQFVIVQIPEPEALITGLVRKVGGAPLPGAQVRVSGEPWLSLTGGAGTFATLAKPGERNVIGSDPADGNSGEAVASLADADAVAEVEIQTALTGPRVLAVTPAAGAQKVSPVTPVVVVFSKPLAPATMDANGVVLTKDGEPTAVQAAISLNGAGTSVSLFPTNPLDAGTTYRVRVSASLTDLAGNPVEGVLESIFTVLPTANRGEAGQLVIYEPGGAGPTPADRALIDAIPGYEPGKDLEKVVAIGSAGTADPEVPVILVNESTGTTATVLSKPDGSFANFIDAAEEDFISAVFVNTNGTRITIPATRQKFDDGRVGLYRQGGILEAESDGSGPRILVQPDSVSVRTVFKVGPVSTQEVLELTGNTQPESGKILGGINFQEEGELTRTYSDLIFPINIADLGLSPGVDPANCTYALTVPRIINGSVVYDIIDGMTFRPTTPGKGELFTASPPFVGLLLRQVASLRQETGLTSGLREVSRTIASGAINSILPVGTMVVPILMAEVSQTNLRGTCFVQTPALDGSPSGSPPSRTPLAGAVIRLGPPQLELAPDIFSPGAFITTSDREGNYALRLPSFISKAVVATHRRFPGQTIRTGVANAGIISGTRADFIFIASPPPELSIEDNSPPQITVTQSSLLATIGDTPGAGIVITETISDDLAIDVTSATGPKLKYFTSLIGNNEINLPASERALLEGTSVSADASGLPTILQRQWHLRSLRSGRATYEFSATDLRNPNLPSSNPLPTTITYSVVFSNNAPNPADPNLPPRVVSFAWPPDKSQNIARGTPVTLRFSRPLDESQVTALSSSDEANPPWLTTTSASTSILNTSVSPDRREMVISYWLSDPAANSFGFTIDPSVALKNPSAVSGGQASTETFTYAISLAPQHSIGGSDAPQPTLEGTFGGVVQQGAHVWAIERGTESGKLLHFEITKENGTSSLNPRPENSFDFLPPTGTFPGDGRPMDIALVPGYALNLLTDREFSHREETYLVVLAGPIGSAEEAIPAPKRAHIFRIEPTTGKPIPYRVNARSPTLSGATSLLTRARWDPPFLSYLEIGDSTSISLVTLNGLIREKEESGIIPLPPRVDGVDLNNDGDFCDTGERPSNRGLEFSYAPLDPNERIIDYDLSADFGLLGVISRPVAGPSTDNIFAMVLGGSAGPLDDSVARIAFPHEAKRMKILPRQTLLRPSSFPTPAAAALFTNPGQDRVTRDLALISCINRGGTDARSLLLVIDITNPATPSLLASAAMPLGIGTLNSVIPRSDGLLAVSANNGGLFLLDPTLLMATGPGGETAAIRSQIPGLETNVSTFATSADGINISTQGKTIRTAISQPSITVLRPTFTNGNQLRSAAAIAADVRADPANRSSKWFETLSQLEPARLGGNAALFDSEKPTDPQSHFYVVVQAPGLSASADGTLPLAAAATSSTGLPLLPSIDNRAPTFLGDTSISAALVGYAALKSAHFLANVDFSSPSDAASSIATKLANEAAENFEKGGFVKAFMDGAPSYPDTLAAHRVSNDPTHPLFNTFIAGPIVLVHRDPPRELVENPSLPRSFLRASPFYWVGLSPKLARENDPFLAPFTSRQADSTDLSADVSLKKLGNVAKKSAEALKNSGPSLVSIGQIGLQLSTLVDAEFTRTFEPGHTALVNFGFRRNPVVFVPGLMASHLIDPSESVPAKAIRWLSLSAGLRAHARTFIPEGAEQNQRIADLESKLSQRLADLAFLPDKSPLKNLDTQDVLRRVGLGDVVADLAADDFFSRIFSFAQSLLSAFNLDLPAIDPNSPLARVVLNRVNKPIYDPVLVYLSAHLGLDEYRNNGRQAALSLKGSPNWTSLRSAPELFSFPYDWRRDVRTNSDLLAEYVRLIRTVHPDAPSVDIVCHSMGGLIARNFVIHHPGQVDRFISINSPFLGAPKALNAMKNGDLGEFSMSILMPENRMKIVTRHMPAIHQLLPSRHLFDLGLPVLVEDGINLDQAGTAYDVLNYAQYQSTLDSTHFFKVPEREIQRIAATAGQLASDDRHILETPPVPISSHNQPLHDGPQSDWSGDTFGGTRYFHLVSLQNHPATITGLRARPVLIPAPLQKNLSLSLPPVELFDSEEKTNLFEPLIPENPSSLRTDPKRNFILTWGAEPFLGGGDATVPFLSQTRGYGLPRGQGNFNHPDAFMAPIVPPSASAADELAGHNDSLANPQLLAWLGKALQDEVVKEDQPKLSLTPAAAAATLGQSVTLNAQISDEQRALSPGPGRAPPARRIVWDMGDGTVLQGESVTHTYSRPGNYTVSCALSYEPGALLEVPPSNPDAKDGLAANRTESLRDISRRPTFGAVSATKVVINRPSTTPTLSASEAARPNQPVTLTLALPPFQPVPADGFVWDFGDGSPPFPADRGKYTTRHTYSEAGSYQVTVSYTTQDGTVQEASTTVVVSTTAPAPAPPTGNDPTQPSKSPPTGPTTVHLIVSGHSANPDDLIIRNDTRLARLGSRLVDVSSGTNVLRPGYDFDTTIEGGLQVISIHRNPLNTQTTSITLRGNQARLSAYFDASPAPCFTLNHSYSPPLLTDHEITYTIHWDRLPSLTEADLPAIAAAPSSFTLENKALFQGRDSIPPGINSDFDETTQEISIQLFDNARPLVSAPSPGEPPVPTSPVLLHASLPSPPGTASADPAGFDPFEEVTVQTASSTIFSGSAAPGAVVPQDASGNPTPPSPNESPANVAPELTLDAIKKVQDAVKATFTDVKSHILYQRFIFSHADLLILEQGSGALLWKANNGPNQEINFQKVQGVYKPGSSDNDYEIYFPVFRDPSRAVPSSLLPPEERKFPGSPADPVDFARFPLIAHTPEMMTGDWYFKRPIGFATINGSLQSLGPVPDPADVDAYNAYIELTEFWQYDFSQLDGNPLSGAWNGRITKGDSPFLEDEENLFDHPVTPAEIISFLLTRTVQTNPERREILKDVSFFPFRREHLLFANLSLEKPPAFGDDPIGDAGMGRQLLLLKWLLEGAFLPAFDEFNKGIDDASLRNEIFERLSRRRSSIAVESFEWGIYQQWALLSESAHLRVRPRGFQIASSQVQQREKYLNTYGTFLDTHDNKILKKTGKSAIRATLARLAADPSLHAKIFDTAPGKFDADLNMRSFEHYIAILARKALATNSSLLPADADTIDIYLKAKLGDKKTFARIREAPGGIDLFLVEANAFLSSVQSDSTATFSTNMRGLLQNGFITEFDRRRTNALTIDFGTQTLDGPRPGRYSLAGRGDATTTLNYQFIVNLNRNHTGPSPEIRLDLFNPADQSFNFIPAPGEAPFRFQPDETSTTIKDKRLAVSRLAIDAFLPATQNHSITLTAAPALTPEQDAAAKDNSALLESEVLLVNTHDASTVVPGRGNRIVYRGLRMSNQRFNELVSGQLQQGRLLAPYRFYRDANNQPIDLDEAKNLLRAEFETKKASGEYAPHSLDDFERMSDDEKLAVAHSGHEADANDLSYSPFISTTEAIEIALNFALEQENDRRVLLAIEAPENAGFRFVPSAINSPSGRNFLRRFNEEEGSEVAYLDDLRFVRCHAYEVLKNNADDHNGLYSLQYIGTFGAPNP